MGGKAHLIDQPRSLSHQVDAGEATSSIVPNSLGLCQRFSAQSFSSTSL